MYYHWCGVLVLVSIVEARYKFYGLTKRLPGQSCKAIYLLNPTSHGKSGNYIIRTDKLITVYCDISGIW